MSEVPKKVDPTEANLKQATRQMNDLINSLYDEIAQKIFSLDPFIIPTHGILHPSKENPSNLFKRQLKLEELSFELAHAKYQKSLNDLIKIGRADQLAASHRYILSWIKAFDAVIVEQ